MRPAWLRTALGANNALAAVGQTKGALVQLNLTASTDLQVLTGKKVVVVVCGGNIDVNFLARIIERGLVKDGRLVRLRIKIRDYPGSLHAVTGLLAETRANILSIVHDRAYYGVSLGETAVEVTVETRGREHIDELAARLAAANYSFERVL